MNQRSGQSDIDRVRESIDLVALIGETVALKPRGREHVGLCPFHDDHSPSLAVVTHKGNAFYKCHACGASGDAFTFVINYHKKDFAEALTMLAERAGITLERRQRSQTRSGDPSRAEVREANALAAAFFQRTLRDSSLGAAARAVLEQREISEAMIERFLLGAAPPGFTAFRGSLRGSAVSERAAVAAGLLKSGRDDGSYDSFRNRLIFPICDEMGQPVAFGGRRLDPEDQPKYLNSSESPVFQKSRTLYGLHLAKRSIIDSSVAIVVEGYTDVIASHQAGIENCVGTLGTALTTEHAHVLSRLCHTVVLVFDGDEAGRRAADRGIEVFFKEPVDIRICVLPEGSDPAELLGRPGGEAQFRHAIDHSQDALTYVVERFSEHLARESTMAGREKLLREFLGHLSSLGFSAMQGVRKRWVLGRLSELLSVPIGDIERMLPRARRGAVARSSPPPPGTAEIPASDGQLLEQTVIVSRARRLAEQELLSVVIFDPQVALRPIRREDGSEVALLELVSAEDLVDSACRAIGRFVFAHLAEGDLFSVPQLLSALEHEPHRHVASSLYFEGQRRCGADGERSEEALAETALSLAQRMASDAYHQHVARRDRMNQMDPEQRIEALQSLLEKRRLHGDVTTAISMDVRS